MDIEASRQATANNIYQNYDFSYYLEDATGWKTDGSPDQMTKVVFFEDPEDKNAPTIKGQFTVHFEPGTAMPTEAVCNVRGEIVGNIMDGELVDYMVEESSPGMAV